MLSKCPNLSQVPLFDFFTGVFTLFELVVQEERTQVAGVVMVLDCKGFGLSHVRWAHHLLFNRGWVILELALDFHKFNFHFFGSFHLRPPMY